VFGRGILAYRYDNSVPTEALREAEEKGEFVE
jgi:hypothetical protein